MFSKRTDWSLAPNRLSRLVAARKPESAWIDLTESNATRCGFNYPAEKILRALGDARALAYEPDPRGLLAARLAVADYYAERGFRPDPAHIFLTTGTSESYSYLFRLLADPGDEVLAPRPSYPLFEYLGPLDAVKPVDYPLAFGDGWQIDTKSLREKVSSRSRAILVVHPNNPTGSFVSRNELEFLVDCCHEHRLALIVDEVFRDYRLASDAALDASFESAQSSILTFTLNGLSKIAALPQMKLGWILAAGPPHLLGPALARLELISDTYLSVSAPLACAMPWLLEMRREMQHQILERLRANLRELDEQLSPPSTVSRLPTAGGWYAVLRVPAIQGDEDWALEIFEREDVLVQPGHFYDFASEGHLVVSLLPRQEVFQKGMAKLLRVIRRRAG